jgi:hypothetical protein
MFMVFIGKKILRSHVPSLLTIHYVKQTLSTEVKRSSDPDSPRRLFPFLMAGQRSIHLFSRQQSKSWRAGKPWILAYYAPRLLLRIDLLNCCISGK